MTEAATEKPYTIQKNPIPLEMLSEGPGGECWYRIPSWRVEFHHEALAGVDVRAHRGLAHDAPWTLSEGTTGHKMYEGWDDEPDDEMEDVIEEFIAIYLPKLTKEKVEKSLSMARETLSKRTPSPFAAHGESTKEEK